MSDRIDKFFKAKLIDYDTAPTPGAWSQVKVNLSKKNSGIAWFRAAAALIILGLLLATIVWVQSKKIETLPTTVITKVDTSQEKEAPLIDKAAAKEMKSVIQKKQQAPLSGKELLVSHEKNSTIEQQVPQEIEQFDINQGNNPIAMTESIAISQSKTSKPIVIEFRLEEIVSLKQLTERGNSEVVEVDTKSGIQKAIGFALEVKNGESPILNIRMAKENLFALNFKKDKKTTTQQ